MKATVNPLKVDRLKNILDILNQKKRVSLADLEKQLNASRVTIQRDLVELEQNQLIKRFHGGAMSLDYSKQLFDLRIRKNINVEVKKSIVKKAVPLIKTHSYIGLDASSTAYYISEEILPRDITIVTCNLDTFSSLTSSGHNAVLTGGRLNQETHSLTGPEAIQTIRQFHFDMVLMSAAAYVPGHGFYDNYENEVHVKKELIKNAIKTVMLLDTSKVKKRGGIKICGKADVDILITSDPGHKKLAGEFKSKLI